MKETAFEGVCTPCQILYGDQIKEHEMDWNRDRKGGKSGMNATFWSVCLKENHLQDLEVDDSIK
jgi:hypothetical protein